MKLSSIANNSVMRKSCRFLIRSCFYLWRRHVIPVFVASFGIVVICICITYASDSTSTGWVITNGNLQYLGNDGQSRKTIKLSSSQVGDKDYKTIAFTSADRQHAVVFSAESNEASGHTQMDYFNPDGTLAWQKNAVDPSVGVEMSDDGGRLLIAQSDKDGCNMEGDVCTYTVFVLDQNGKEILKLGTFMSVYRIGLTRNGKFGYAKVWKGPGSPDSYLFFSSDEGTIIPKTITAQTGDPVLKEDGTVELTKFTYGAFDGKKQPILGSVVLEKLTIN